MMFVDATAIQDPRVAGVGPSSAQYDESAIVEALENIGQSLNWADARGPFGRIVPAGAKVLIKPNLVLHQNQGPWGVEPLVTHASLIRAATRGALCSGAAEVLVGDAPVQGCDFAALLQRRRDSATGRTTLMRTRCLGSRAFAISAAPRASSLTASACRAEETAIRGSIRPVRPRSGLAAGTDYRRARLVPRHVLRPAAAREDARARSASLPRRPRRSSTPTSSSTCRS